MLGMHGTVVANYAVDHADLLLAFGVRFDDRVTGKLEAFATRARIVHIDIDPAEINKNKEAHISVCSDMTPTLKLLNEAVARSPVDPSCYDDWRGEITEQQEKYPQSYPTRDDVIIPQEAVKVPPPPPPPPSSLCSPCSVPFAVSDHHFASHPHHYLWERYPQSYPTLDEGIVPQDTVKV